MLKTKRMLMVVWLLLASSTLIYHPTKAENFWTISIANPDNPSEWITIMDRNLWATSNDINSTASYWYKYQWWNNYGFINWCFTEQWRWCSDSITEWSKWVLDWEQYQYRKWFTRNKDYNNSWYYEPIFYKVNGWPRYHWGEWNYHDWLWWWENDNPDNNRWEKQSNPEDRQWPCPDWFHVPSAWERWLLVKYWKNTYGQDITNYGDNYFYSDTKNLIEYFKLPYAGYRWWNDALLYQQSYEGYYWSSSPYWTPKEYEYWDSQEWLSSDISEYAQCFGLNSNYVGGSNIKMRHDWLPIRCFKNTYKPTEKELTTNKENNKENEKTNENKKNNQVSNESKYNNWNPTDILRNWYTREMNDAYEFAYKNWITTTKNIEKAKMNTPLTRIAMAKMLSYYATNVLWQKPDTTKTIKFNDVTDKQNSDYNNAVTLSYQLWIMWQNMKNNNFRPNDEVTRAEFATALSRMLYSTPDWSPYYTTHLNKLKQEGIITNNNPKLKEKRWYVMIMLMRTTE